jgi:hypothetical protein
MQQRLEQMLRLALGFALLGTQPLEFVDDIVTDEPSLLSSTHAFLQPPHKVMSLSLPNHSEPKPFVEASRRVDFENLQFDTPRLLDVGPHGGAVQPPQKVVILSGRGPE